MIMLSRQVYDGNRRTPACHPCFTGHLQMCMGRWCTPPVMSPAKRTEEAKQCAAAPTGCCRSPTYRKATPSPSCDQTDTNHAWARITAGSDSTFTRYVEAIRHDAFRAGVSSNAQRNQPGARISPDALQRCEHAKSRFRQHCPSRSCVISGGENQCHASTIHRDRATHFSPRPANRYRQVGRRSATDQPQKS